MLSFLLGLALAQAPADLETRLLGPEPAPAEAVAPAPVATPSVEASPLPMPPWWTVPLVGLALAAAWTQRRKTEQVEADAMRVLGRSALGKDAAVVLLEVRDAHGGWRRLLVGSGSDGPQLITGLGSTGDATPQTPIATTPPPMAQRAQRAFSAVMDREQASLDSLPEVPAYPVAPTPETMVQTWVREEESESARPVLGPAGARAAAIHGRTQPITTEPPPVRDAPKRSAQEGLELLAEVRRSKGRVGTRVQAYG